MSCKTLSTYYPFPASDLIKDRCVKKEILKLIKSHGGGGGGGGSPSGPAGGSLSGTYPNPSIANSAVGNSQISNRAALSVMGRSANSTGVVADITAGTDGYVLRRSGTTLGFGTVATGGITNDAITNAKLANMGANTIKGRLSTSGDPQDLTVAQVQTLLGLSTVALSGDYNDLTNLPTIPAQVNLTAGSNVTITGTYPNLTISASGGGGGSATWGGITGTLADQTDLNTALSSKVTKGGDSDGTALVVGTTTNHNVRIIANNSPQIEAASGGVITFGGASQFSLTAATNRIIHNAVNRHEWRVNNQSSFQMSFSSNGLGVGLPNNTSSSATLQVVGNTLLEGTSPTTGYIASLRNSSGTVVAQFNNNNTVQFNSLSGTGTGVVIGTGAGTLTIERPPASGTYTLKSIDGVIQWVED